jgi:hypothetical protein
MISPIIANGAIPYFAAQTFAGVLLLIPVVVIEAVILKKLLKKKLRETLGLCAIANITSTFAGIFFILIEIPSYSLPVPINVVLIVVSFLLAFVLSVGIEYGIYRNSWTALIKRQLFMAVLMVNVVTYIPLTTLAVYVFLKNGRAPERTCRISCASNLKMIGVALRQYAADHDGYLPDKQGVEGLEQLRGNNYLTDNCVYQCPSCRLRKEQEKKLAEDNISYVYQGGLRLDEKDSKTPVVWDKVSNHKNYGSVLFLNCIVESFEGADWLEQAGVKKLKADKESCRKND